MAEKKVTTKAPAKKPTAKAPVKKAVPKAKTTESKAVPKTPVKKAMAKTTESKVVPKELVKKAVPKKAPVKKPAAKPVKFNGPSVNVYSLDGKAKGRIKLPELFDEQPRPDLIRKAVTASRANRRQPYAPKPYAGMMHSVATLGKGTGRARVQRMMNGRYAAESPNNVSGRRAHPPRVEKNWAKKINKKEVRKARFSALAMTMDTDVVAARGHKFNPKLTLPLIVDNKFEKLGTTKEAEKTLQALGIYDDIVRGKEGRHIRAGRGKMRGRRYKQPKTILFVLKDMQNCKAIRNLPGTDITTVKHLSTEMLAPGGDPGRLTVISEAALQDFRRWVE